MNIEDKKFLAEWMGWRVVYKRDPWRETGFEVFERNTDFGTAELQFNEFRPDTDHKQFAEVWEKLPVPEREYWEKMQWSGYTGFGEKLLKDLPDVLDKIIERLKI
ncbi:MAG: hypothetical protein GY861_14485 [bacterium]|nr:hypothetical protein [bacterium]